MPVDSRVSAATLQKNRFLKLAFHHLAIDCLYGQVEWAKLERGILLENRIVRPAVQIIVRLLHSFRCQRHGQILVKR